MSKPKTTIHRLHEPLPTAGGSAAAAQRPAWRDNRLLQALIIRKWALLLTVTGFLLGRAAILGDLTPFTLAFFAVIYYLRSDIILNVGVAMVAGSLLSLPSHTGYVVTELLVFLLIQKGVEKFERAEPSLIPLIVFGSSFLVGLMNYALSASITWYTLMMTGIQAVLSFVLTLIFLQAVPVLTQSKQKAHLRNEEIICLIIMLASVMTGTVGWLIEGVSVEHIFSRYLILLFALVGGAPLGASVGVITGLILSLADIQAVYQMSLLAFAGLLAGLMREGNKWLVALGMLLGSSILTVYVGSQDNIIHSTWETGIAVLLFLLTPRTLIQTLAKYVPGTTENMKTHYEYAKRVRDITASRVEQFSEVFQQLSKSFKQLTEQGQEHKREEMVSQFMNSVANQTCTSCWKKNQCWGDKQFYETYAYMNGMMEALEQNENLTKKDITPDWKKACAKTDQVLDVMKHQYMLYRHDLQWKKQILESRQLVSEQLIGVSQVMEDLAKEIKREGQELHLQEEEIRSALEGLGLSIMAIDVINLEEGNVEIEIMHQYTKGFDECRKIIAPLLSDILGENIAVKKETYSEKGEGFCTVTFGSAKEYEVETGIAGAAKGGDLLSGDSFSTAELGNGKFVVALSDGMGNGERARMESSTALTILQQLLQSGMDEKLAIKSVNSVLLLRSPDEMYATVDMALIDLYSAHTTFMKIGSTPSFIKRGGEVLQVTANNLPVGILQDIEVDLVSVQLMPGDVLIMMTDGIYDAPGYAVNKELWMKRVIGEIDTESPQEFADCLLERIVRQQHGEISDDMTVIVARIERYRPEWSTFRWPGLAKLERPKTVS